MIPLVLVVDDERRILNAIERDLRPLAIDIITTTQSDTAVEVLRDKTVALILSDLRMPDMDGVTLLQKAIEISPDTIRMVLTGSTDSKFFEASVNEAHISMFLMKPWDRAGLQLAVKQCIDQFFLKKQKDILEQQIVAKNKQLVDWNERLEKLVAERTHEISLTQEATILSLTALTETRDNETGNHIIRTQTYVRALSEKLAENEKFASFLTPHTIDMLFKSAPLHDIGKVGIPDCILKKEGKLSDKEFEIMKQHAIFGRRAISKAENRLGALPFLTLASEIAYSHHEHWDGTGYPEGLSGDDIPLSARIMALADVYDALITERCYKKAFSHESAVEVIIAGCGTQFQPEIVDAFALIHPVFAEIAQKHADC